MASYLYAFDDPLPRPPAEEGGLPGGLIKLPVGDDLHVYISDHELDLVSLPSGFLIGAWDAAGELLDGVTVHPLYFELRPFGNGPAPAEYDEAGNVISDTENLYATSDLDWYGFMGNSQRKVLRPEEAEPGIDRRYPADRQPYILRFERLQEEDGMWTWRADVIQEDANRRPNQRTIGVHNEDWTLDYVAAAFQKVEIGVLPYGEVLERYRVTCPPGQRLDEPAPMRFTLRRAAFEESRFVLPVEKNMVEVYCWDSPQIPNPAAAGGNL